MLQKLIKFLLRLGVVDGVTFRAVPEDGVGLFLEPNPRPNRMNPQAVAMPDGRVKPRRRVSGRWTAKPLHIIW